MKDPRAGFSREGLWQLVESGGYRADLPLWEMLADQPGSRILDIGCGIGRVSHHLNRLGHFCVGIDNENEIVRDFNLARPADSPEAVFLDATEIGAKSCPVSNQPFDLVLAPQQLLQVLSGSEERIKMLRALPGIIGKEGCLAFAICEDLPFDSISYPDVPPDLLSAAGWIHSSQPVEIVADPEEVRVVRSRRSEGPAGEKDLTVNEVTLQRFDRELATLEFIEAGLSISRFLPVPSTDRHMASTAIIAHAASA